MLPLFTTFFRKEAEKKKDKYKAGLTLGLSGRDMFTFNPTMVGDEVRFFNFTSYKDTHTIKVGRKTGGHINWQAVRQTKEQMDD
jgi:hypothetical protein